MAVGQCWVEVAAARVDVLSFSTVMNGALDSCALPSRTLVYDVIRFLKVQGNWSVMKVLMTTLDLTAMPEGWCLLPAI